MSTHKLVLGQAQDHNIANGTAVSKINSANDAESSSNIARDKSFVNDLNIKQGIVSMRVAFVPRSVEIKP